MIVTNTEAAELAQAGKILACPYCGGEGLPCKDLRDGYGEYQSDPDAWAHYVRCRSCAAQGPWCKNPFGAIRMWNMRAEATI